MDVGAADAAVGDFEADFVRATFTVPVRLSREGIVGVLTVGEFARA